MTTATVETADRLLFQLACERARADDLQRRLHSLTAHVPPRRCIYCGARCRARACPDHLVLLANDPEATVR